MEPDDAFPVFGLLRTEKKSGKEAVFDVIEKATGERPSDSTFRQWKNAYGRIPAKFIVPLIYELNRRKIKFKDDVFNSTVHSSKG